MRKQNLFNIVMVGVILTFLLSIGGFFVNINPFGKEVYLRNVKVENTFIKPMYFKNQNIYYYYIITEEETFLIKESLFFQIKENKIYNFTVKENNFLGYREIIGMK